MAIDVEEFIEAVKDGNNLAVQAMWENANKAKRKEIIRAGNDECKEYGTFITAALNGQTTTMEWLCKQVSKKEALKMIRAGDNDGNAYLAFRSAACNGHITTMEWLCQQAPKEVLKMICIGGYGHDAYVADYGCAWFYRYPDS